MIQNKVLGGFNLIYLALYKSKNLDVVSFSALQGIGSEAS
jgi:hypothetical protein